MNHRLRPPLLIAIALWIVTLAVFSPALTHGFVNWDDDLYVLENTAIHHLSLETVRWSFTGFHAANWHPLTWLSHALDLALFGFDARGHHLTSILLHATNAALLFWALWRMTAAPWASILAAALFALHPLHVESVVWVSERKDVLSTFFWIVTMIAHAAWARRGGARRYLTVVACFACGLLAKPMVVTLPFALLLLDYWPLRRLSLPAVWEKLPLLALSAVTAWLGVLAQRAAGTIQSLTDLGIGDRLTGAAFSYGRYLAKTCWPRGLSPFYPYESGTPAHAPWLVVAVVLLLAAATAAAFTLRRRAPWVTVGWLWYLGTLLPVIGIVHVGSASIADRYTYVPLIGIFILTAWSARRLASSSPGRAVAAGVTSVVVLVTLVPLTVLQVGHWRTPVKLWSHALELYPDSPTVEGKLAGALTDAGDAAQAFEHYRRAIDLPPSRLDSLRGKYRVRILNYLGRHHLWKGELEPAETALLRSIEIKPSQAEAHAVLGAVLAQGGRVPESEARYRQALSNDPDSVAALTGLGVILAMRNETDSAMELWQRALSLDERSVEAHLNLARAYERAGDPIAAVRHYEAALELAPGHAGASRRLRALNN